MKKKPVMAAAIIATALAVLAALLIPFRVNVMNDGGSKEYRALAYRAVKWNSITDDGYYQKTRFYFFGDMFKSIDELWEREEPNIEHRVVARITDYMLDSFLAVPMQGETESAVSSYISVDFSATELEKLGADVGSYVEVTYRGEFPENGAIHPVSVKLATDLRHMEYTSRWLDKSTAEEYDFNLFNHVVITEVFSNCIFARPAIPMPYQIKLNGTLSGEWCVGDRIQFTYKNAYYDKENGRVEADLLTVEASDYEMEPGVCAKPVIYLYPEEQMQVSVRLTLDGKLTCTYPAYKDGWTVTAKPGGTLVDAKGQTYNYLYWEGESNARYDLSKGFCVKGEDTAAFLENALAKLGLNRREANEFIVYWLPLMEGNPYNIISFQADRYIDSAQLEIDPAPDTLIRVFMAWQASDTLVELPEQELTAPERTGFTVVEWGGSQLS